MATVKTSGASGGCYLLLALTLSVCILVTFPSCGRNRKGITSFSKLEPPPLPPPPPKVPSMAGSDTTWDLVDQIPMFPGGEELLGRYVAMNTKYPEAAKEKGIQGRVVVKFRITSKGTVNGYEIWKSAGPELDAEALRVVKTITRFEPAIVDGKPVTAWFYLPISFALK
jgi:TonB family protein